MAHKIGKKQLIINDPAQAPLLFFAVLAGGKKNLIETSDDFQTTLAYDQLLTSPDTQDAEGTTFAPADVADNESIAKADMLRIVGFADLVGVNISEVIGTKGIAAAKQVSTLTFTVTTATAGDEVQLDFTYISDGLEGDFASNMSDYKLKRTVLLTIAAGETATTLAAKLVNQINGIIDAGWQSYVTVSSAAGVVTLTSVKGTITFTIGVTQGSAITAGRVAAAFATTTVGYPGRNTYDQLKGLRLQTEGSVAPFNIDQISAQLPIKTAKYSTYLIKKNVSRPDLAGFNGLNQIPTGQYEFELIINETTCANYITSLTKWLNANVAKRSMYTATTAAVAVAVEAATTAVATDDVAPFTTPLV